MKLCKDCKHYRIAVTHANVEHDCRRPIVSLVNGDVRERMSSLPAHAERHGYNTVTSDGNANTDRCGHEGRYWEAK